MATHHPTNIRSTIQKFYSVITTDKTDLSAIYLFAILTGLIQLSLPLGIQTIINFVMAGSVSTSIVVLIGLVVFGTFASGLLQVKQLEIIEKLKQKIFLRYSFAFSNQIPKIQLERIDNHHLPELSNRFFDTVSLQKGIEKVLLDLPAALIQIMFGLVLLSFYHPVFIAFGILLLLIVALILRFTFNNGFHLAMEASSYKYAVAGWIQELSRVVKTFKFGKEGELHLQKTDKEVSGYLIARTKYFHVLKIQFWSLISFKIVITAAMLILGSVLLVNQKINVGQFIAADIVIIAIISSVEKLIVSLDKIYDTLVSFEKLSIITDAEIEKNGTVSMQYKPGGVSVDFKQVYFSYPDGKEVLKDIRLSIPAGHKTLVTGMSGSGKSTLLRLLTGAYTGFTGVALIDQLPVTSYDISDLRANTGILLNNQDIFQGTILENITLGKESISRQEILSLSEKTGLLAFLHSLPAGLDTPIDPFGNRLPKKIRQQILLTRAISGKHNLLLLEEPFLCFDEKDKTAFMEWMNTNISATVIVVSEDKSLAGQFNQVVHLENGFLQLMDNGK